MNIIRAILRIFRILIHILRGIFIVSFRYRSLSLPERAVISRFWVQHLLSIFHLKIEVLGNQPPPKLYPENTLLIANHISWLDIFVMCSFSVPRFVGKKEVKSWPVIGWLSEQVGTIFIDRSNKGDSDRVNRLLAQALLDGSCMAVFPESTTTDGQSLLPFKVSLFESVLRAHGVVYPMAMRYLLPSGETAERLDYAGDKTFLQSVWGALTTPKATVQIIFGCPIHVDPNRHHDRVDLAIEAHVEVSRLMELYGWVSMPIPRMLRIVK